MKFIFFAMTLLLLAGCASTDRPEFSADIIARASADRLNGVRYAADQPPPALQNKSDSFRVLALSGGGPDGAYGVGLLTGWSATGTRPEFDVVTGVSTGALIAPYAFLGARKDDTLRKLYTGGHLKSLVKDGSAFHLLWRSNVYSNVRPKKMIGDNMSSAVLREIADQHRKGRRLYVATANLDAQKMMIWDMGAIAVKNTAAGDVLFRTILLAATSVPLALNPIAMPVASAPRQFTETHVDASVFALVYAGSELFPATCKTRQQKCSLHVIIHNKQVSEPKTVRWSAPGIGQRVLETMVKANLTTRLQATYQMTQAAGVDFRMAYLDVPFASVSPIDFNVDYMQQLFDLGLNNGRDNSTWLISPPTR
jgi:predicted acylesterase/phospholipase RssA